MAEEPMVASEGPARMRRPFIIFMFLSCAFLSAFAGWTALVLGASAVVEIDQRLAHACASHSPEHPITRGLMVVATYCGGVRANMVIALGGAFWMWRHHRRRFAIAWLCIAIGGGLIVLELKERVDRDRPPAEIRDRAVHQENESYPSGHAMGSVVGYGMLGLVLVQANHRRRIKGVIALGLTAWVLLIGFSRIYLRAHWFSDVVGGFLLGLAYTHLCLAIYLWRRGARGPAAEA